MLWTAAELTAAVSGRKTGDWDGATGVSIDTRDLRPGDLFIALKGADRDGHAFVGDALAKGAGAAMVSKPHGSSPNPRLLTVADTLRGLHDLGRAGRARTAARVIAVTGSVGKTSTKDMLRLMLADQGGAHASAKSFNNHLGVPLTLARMPADARFAAIEIGMNHAGEIAPLSRMTRPDAAIVTTVEAAHLAHFDSVEDIADAKAEIFAGLAEGGVALLNRDNPHFGRLAKRLAERFAERGAARPARIVGFGTDGDLRLRRAETRGETTEIDADFHGAPMTFRIAAAGRHFALNAVAALGAVAAVGGDPARAAAALARWTQPEGRGRREDIALAPGGPGDPDGAGKIALIDESYNANPASMRAALAVLGAASPPCTTGRRIAFLGDMLELGARARDLHAGLADAEGLDRVDLVHCCGPLMKALHRALPRDKRGVWTEDSAGLAERAGALAAAGDACMVKGSLGSRMGLCTAAIRALAHSPNEGAEAAGETHKGDKDDGGPDAL